MTSAVKGFPTAPQSTFINDQFMCQSFGFSCFFISSMKNKVIHTQSSLSQSYYRRLSTSDTVLINQSVVLNLQNVLIHIHLFSLYCLYIIKHFKTFSAIVYSVYSRVLLFVVVSFPLTHVIICNHLFSIFYLFFFHRFAVCAISIF